MGCRPPEHRQAVTGVGRRSGGGRLFALEELLLVKLSVKAALSQEFVVAAAGDDAALL